MGVERGPHSTAPGQRRSFGSISLWAEDGLVFFEDQKTGDTDVIDIKTAKERMKMFIGELEVSDKAREGAPTAVKRQAAIAYYHQLRTHVEQLDETIKDAERQGDYANEEFRKKRLVQFLRSKRANLMGDISKVAPADLIYQGIQGPIIFGPHSQQPQQRRVVELQLPDTRASWLGK